MLVFNIVNARRLENASEWIGRAREARVRQRLDLVSKFTDIARNELRQVISGPGVYNRDAARRVQDDINELTDLVSEHAGLSKQGDVREETKTDEEIVAEEDEGAEAQIPHPHPARALAASARKRAGRATTQSAKKSRTRVVSKEHGRYSSEEDGKHEKARGDDEGLVPQMIGKGASSCVYSPPLPCLEDEHQFAEDSLHKASKYAPWSEVEKEQRVYDILGRIDPDHSFHVRLYGICKARRHAPCGHIYVLNRRLQEPGLLVMERAPKTLEDTLVNAVDEASVQIVGNTAHMIRAFQTMARAGIQYNDLHKGNIVVGSDGTWKLVDFGLVDITTSETALENVEYLVLQLLTIYAQLRPSSAFLRKSPAVRKLISSNPRDVIRELGE